MQTIKQIYTVHVNGQCRYHGVNQGDALETIIAASETESDIQVQRNAQVVQVPFFSRQGGFTS